MANLFKKIKELREITMATIDDCKKALTESNEDIDLAIKWLKENGIAKAGKKVDRTASEGLTSVKIANNKAVIIELNCETDFAIKSPQFIQLLNSIEDLLLKNSPKNMDEVLKIKDGNEDISEKIKLAISVIGENINLRRFEVLDISNEQSFGHYIHMKGKISVLLQFDKKISDEVAREIAIQAAVGSPKFISHNLIPVDQIAIEKEIIIKQLEKEKKPANIIEKIVEGRLKKELDLITLTEQNSVMNPDKKIGQILKENNDVNIIKMYRYQLGEGIEKVKTNFADDVMAQINSK